MTSSLPIRSALAVVALAIAAAVAGCGPAINSGTVSGPVITSAIRVINGSRDVTAFDGYLNATTNLSIAGTINYGTVSPFVNVTAANGITLLVQKPGTTDNTSTDRYLTCALPNLVAGQYYTIVVAGIMNPALVTPPTALQCQVFKETSTTGLGVTANDVTINVHNAAPVLAAQVSSTYSFGNYTPAPSPSPAAYASTPVPATYGTPIATATYTPVVAGGNIAYASSIAVPVAQATSFPGIGVYVQTSTTGTPVGTPPAGSFINPISALLGFTEVSGSANTLDIEPYLTSSTFSVYLLDSQVGVVAPNLVALDD